MKCLAWLIGATNKLERMKRTVLKGRRKMSFFTLHLCSEGGLEPIRQWLWKIAQSKGKWSNYGFPVHIVCSLGAL